MKALKLFIVFILFSQSVLANNQPQQSDMEMIIRAMAEQYAKSVAQDLALQELKKQAAKVVGEQVAAQMADTTMGVLAIVGFVQNVQSYDAASTESGKYSAAAHAVAAAISYAFSAVPLVGLAVNLQVLGQDMMAAYISKDFMLEQARIIAEISQLEKETTSMKATQMNAEFKALQVLRIRLKIVNEFAAAYSIEHEGKCEKNDFDFKTPAACFYSLMNLREVLGKQVQTLGLILKFKGRFLNLNIPPEEYKNLLADFKAAEEQYNNFSNSMNSVINQVIFGEIWNVKQEHNAAFLPRRCETSLIVTLKNLLTAKKDLLQSEERDVWLESSVSKYHTELNNLALGACAEYLKTAPERFKAQVTRVLQK